MSNQTKVLIVGVGLIGGSISLALKDSEEYIFAGLDNNNEHLEDAKNEGLIQISFENFYDAIAWADIIFLTIPVDAIKDILPKVLDNIKSHQTVVDFGSTKANICQVADIHKNRKQFIAAHPIAGTEHSGPTAAFNTLFKNKNIILCDTEKCDQNKLALFESFAKKIGFSIIKMGANEHDLHLAYISHLSHISSFVLSNTVLKKENNGEIILDLAGSGFESTVRLAKSSPKMWSSIFLENKKMVLEGIEAYKSELDHFEKLIKEGNSKEILNYLTEGRKIKEILK